MAGPYQLVLLDPPYRMDGLDQVLNAIASQEGLVVAGGVVVAGHSKRSKLGASFGKLRQTSHRQYGDNVVDFFTNQGITDGADNTDGARPLGETPW